MQIKDQEQALKLQEEFKARLADAVEALRKGKPPSMDATLKDRQKLIARAQVRLEEALKERETVLQHWDKRVDALKDDVQRLQDAVGEIKERLSGAPEPPRGAPREIADRKKKKR